MFHLLTWARWACIPLSVLGAVVCFLWARAVRPDHVHRQSLRRHVPVGSPCALASELPAGCGRAEKRFRARRAVVPPWPMAGQRLVVLLPYYPYAMAVKGTLGGMLLILLAAVWAALNPAGRASSRDELLLVVRALAHICTKYTRHVIGQSGLLFAEEVFTCTHRAQLLASLLETGASGAAAPASVQAACI